MMGRKDKKIEKAPEGTNHKPFECAEEAWFWFINAQQAKIDGARFSSGMGQASRPCEPLDILQIIDRLYRNRRLMRDHLLVLRHYGRRQMPPDSRRIKEARSAHLWREALARIEPALQNKGIVNTHTGAGASMKNNDDHHRNAQMCFSDVIVYKGGEAIPVPETTQTHINKSWTDWRIA